MGCPRPSARPRASLLRRAGDCHGPAWYVRMPTPFVFVTAARAGSECVSLADRLPDRVPGERVIHLEAAGLPKPVIPRPISKLSGRWVTYVPYDPSLETPDEGGTNGRLTWIHSVRESSPAECSWPFLIRRSQSRSSGRGVGIRTSQVAEMSMINVTTRRARRSTCGLHLRPRMRRWPGSDALIRGLRAPPRRRC